MAQGKDPVTRENGGSRSHQIEADIDRTRAAMDRTVDAIAGKLTPQQLAFEALGVFKDGSSALATKLVQTAREHPVPATIIGIGIGLLLTEKSKGESGTRFEGRQVGFGSTGGRHEGVSTRYDTGAGYEPSGMSTAGEGVRGEGVAAGAMHKVENAAGAVRDKAVDMKDTVAAGAMHAKEKVGETAGQVKEQASHLKDAVAEKTSQVKEGADHLREKVGETAGHVREQAAQVPVYARQQWHDAKLGFWQTMDQSPFAVGLAVLAAGVVAGLSVPTSRKEDELMGETRDRLLDQAKGLTREAMDKGKQVARATGEMVKSEAERQGLSAADIAQKVRTIGREAEQALKSEAEKVAPESLKATGAPLRAGQDDTLPGGAAGRGMTAGFASASTAPAATSSGSPGTGMGSTTGANTKGAGTTGTANTTGGSMGPTTGTGTKGNTTKT